MISRKILIFASAMVLFYACNKDNSVVVPDNNPKPRTHSHIVTMKAYADADTRTALHEGDDMATFYWSETDEYLFRVYENDIEATDMTVVFSDDYRQATILAEFAASEAATFEYKAVYGPESVPAVQYSTSASYDPSADILSSGTLYKGNSEDIEELTLNFNRVVSISKMTIKGLVPGETLTKVDLTADKAFAGESTTLTLNCSEKVNSAGQASLFFITDPVAAIKFTIKVTGTSTSKTHEFKNALTLSTGSITRFSVDLASGSEDDGDKTDAKYRWYELPAIKDANHDNICDNDPNLYLAYHLCAGGEKGPGGKTTARNYTVCYSATHHCPLWVAAPRHKMYEGSAKRTDSYQVDPDIPAGYQYNSKSTGGGCNKGHMLGSAERTSSTATNRQVFYYTNIAPQNSTTFNTGGGAWNNLEDYIDTQVCTDTLYEVVGCYFKKYTDAYGTTCNPSTITFGGRSDVSKPTMFYYALLRTKKGDSGKDVTKCSASELQCVAFVMSHAMAKGHKPQVKDMISISDLETLTGITYFPTVPNAPKDSFSASDWDL